MVSKSILKILSVFILIVVVCAGLFACSEQQDSQVASDVVEIADESDSMPKLYYFYDEACSSCVPEEESAFIELYNEVHGGELKEEYPMEVVLVNVFKLYGRELLEEVTAQYGLETPTSFPVVVISGVVLSGDSIEKRMSEQCIVAHEMVTQNEANSQDIKVQNELSEDELFDEYELPNDSINMVYFYRIQCPDCQSIEPFMEELPTSVLVDGEDTPLNIIYINTREPRGGDRVYKMFDEYSVSDDDQQVPILFYNGGYLSGAEAVETGLLPLLESDSNSDLLGFTLP